MESLCYLRGHRFHFAFFLLILLVGPQIDGKLFTPPVNKDKHGRDISQVGNCSCRFSTVSYWPINDLFIVTTDEYFLLRRDDAESISLARPGLGIADVCAQIHVHGALWQSAWLEKNQNTSKLFRWEVGEPIMKLLKSCLYDWSAERRSMTVKGFVVLRVEWDLRGITERGGCEH